MSARVLHVLPALSRGGGTRAALALARAASGYEHSFVSLRALDDPTPARVREAGFEVLEAAPIPAALSEIERADLVHVAFWNTPEIYELLRAELPDCRLAIWSQIDGRSPPQVLTPEVGELADRLVSTTPAGDVEVIPNAPDLDRVEARERPERDGFVVTYVGTVDPAKMHPRFVELCAAIELDDVRFVVCGSGDGFGAIAERAEELGVRDRFDLRGYVEDVGSVLAASDVFGYPLAPDNYSGSELVLAEAMHAGVPPVVLPYAGAAQAVADGVTGIVARDEAEYPRAVERLARDPGLRARLASGGRGHVAASRSPEVVAAAWAGVYEDLLSGPKRTRSWSGRRPGTGAEAFVAGLGEGGGDFEASLAGSAAADERISNSPRAVVASDGGILDYRRRYPGDPHLRLWAGLVLGRAGRPALAAGELAASLRLGMDPGRVRPHLGAITAGAVAS